MTKVCAVEACDRPAKVRGWCKAHYDRWLRSGNVQSHKPLKGFTPPGQTKICSVEQCDSQATRRGLCNKHYLKWQKYGDPETDNRKKRKTCRMDGCDRPAKARELCDRHYKRWQMHSDPNVVNTRERKVCLVPECDNWVAANGYCRKHAARVRKHGSPYVIRTASSSTCEIKGCAAKVKRHNMCQKHARRVEKHGDASISRKSRRKQCSVDACEKPASIKGLCEMHAARVRKHGNPNYEYQAPLLPDDEARQIWITHGVLPSLNHSDLRNVGRGASLAKMPFVCLNCAMPGQAALNQVKSGKQKPCAYCSGDKINPDIAIARMTRIFLMPRTEFTGNSHDPWEADCMLCGAEVPPHVRRITSKNRQLGCMACRQRSTADKRRQRNLRTTQALADELGYTLQRHWREPIKNRDTSTLWVQLQCNEGHDPYPTSASNFKRGNRCPNCSVGGIRQDEPVSLYVVTSETMIKVGISNVSNLRDRIRSHRRDGFPNVIGTQDFDDYKTPRQLELSWIEYLKGFPEQTIGREYIAWHPDHMDFAKRLIQFPR